jgi:hypothetical protein
VVVIVAADEAETGVFVAGAGGEGNTVGVAASVVETPVDVGRSADIVADGAVANEVGEIVGLEDAFPHPASANITNKNVTDRSNNLLMFLISTLILFLPRVAVQLIIVFIV